MIWRSWRISSRWYVAHLEAESESMPRLKPQLVRAPVLR